MAPDKEPEITKNFIGDMEFGITLKSIQDCFDKMRNELEYIDKTLSKNDIPELLRKHGEERKIQLQQILKIPATEILRLLQTVYDFVCKLENDKTKGSDVIQEISQKKPELIEIIGKFYDILRNQIWGYNLGQALCVFPIQQMTLYKKSF